jgi:hypothetical protein
MVEILTAFTFGFISMWFAFNIDLSRSQKCPLKNSMIEMAKTYPNNIKMCKEIKKYSFDKIKNGNFEYAEVINEINRQTNDKI